VILTIFVGPVANFKAYSQELKMKDACKFKCNRALQAAQ
jgi:hypothetical protein